MIFKKLTVSFSIFSLLFVDLPLNLMVSSAYANDGTSSELSRYQQLKDETQGHLRSSGHIEEGMSAQEIEAITQSFQLTKLCAEVDENSGDDNQEPMCNNPEEFEECFEKILHFQSP